MIKVLQKVSIKRTYINIIKAIYNKYTANIILSGEKQSISSKISNKTRVPTLTSIIQHIFESPSHSNQRRKRNKRNSDWRRKIQLSLFAANMILYRLLLLVLSRFSRVRPSATPWTAAHQALLPMGLSRQEYWSGVPLPSPGYYT